MSETEPPYTVAEVAIRLRLSPRCVTARCKRGTIPAYKEGGVWRIPRQMFETWHAAKLKPVRKTYTSAALSGGYASPRTATKYAGQPGSVLSMRPSEFSRKLGSRSGL